MVRSACTRSSHDRPCSLPPLPLDRRWWAPRGSGTCRQAIPGAGQTVTGVCPSPKVRLDARYPSSTRAKRQPLERVSERLVLPLDAEDRLEQYWTVADRGRRCDRAVARLVFERGFLEDHRASLVGSNTPQSPATAHQHSDRKLALGRAILDVAVRKAEQDDRRPRHASTLLPPRPARSVQGESARPGALVALRVRHGRHPKNDSHVVDLVDHRPRLSVSSDRGADGWNRAARHDNLEVTAGVQNLESVALGHDARIADSSGFETSQHLLTWFRPKRAEVNDVASTLRRSVARSMGGAAMCNRPSRVARRLPPHSLVCEPLLLPSDLLCQEHSSELGKGIGLRLNESSKDCLPLGDRESNNLRLALPSLLEPRGQVRFPGTSEQTSQLEDVGVRDRDAGEPHAPRATRAESRENAAWCLLKIDVAPQRRRINISIHEGEGAGSALPPPLPLPREAVWVAGPALLEVVGIS